MLWRITGFTRYYKKHSRGRGGSTIGTSASGTVYFEGVNLPDKKVNIDKHGQKIGMVFQVFNVFLHLTVLESITLDPILEKKLPKSAAEKRGCKLLACVGLLEKKDQYPTRLSGSQKQRLTIVRALVTEPDVTLFDKPMINQGKKLEQKL